MRAIVSPVAPPDDESGSRTYGLIAQRIDEVQNEQKALRKKSRRNFSYGQSDGYGQAWNSRTQLCSRLTPRLTPAVRSFKTYEGTEIDDSVLIR